MFTLDGLRGAFFELLAATRQPDEIHARYDSMLALAVDYAGVFSIVKDEARDRNMRLKILDPVTNVPRRFGIEDLPELTTWITAHHPMVVVSEMVAAVARTLGWGNADAQTVLRSTEAHIQARCGTHGLPRCQECWSFAVCNGHDMQVVMALDFSASAPGVVTVEELAAKVRAGVDRSKLGTWCVVERLRRAENELGCRVLAS